MQNSPSVFEIQCRLLAAILVNCFILQGTAALNACGHAAPPCALWRSMSPRQLRFCPRILGGPGTIQAVSLLQQFLQASHRYGAHWQTSIINTPAVLAREQILFCSGDTEAKGHTSHSKAGAVFDVLVSALCGRCRRRPGRDNVLRSICKICSSRCTACTLRRLAELIRGTGSKLQLCTLYNCTLSPRGPTLTARVQTRARTKQHACWPHHTRARRADVVVCELSRRSHAALCTPAHTTAWSHALANGDAYFCRVSARLA